MAREIPVYIFTPFDRRGAAENGLSPSRRLLAAALARHTGLAEARFAAPALTPRGKPCFPAFPGLFFSVSHSGDLWACAADGEPVGLDVQRILPVSRAADIARRFFRPEDRAYLETSGDPDAFFTVWTAKESFLKYTGQGIDGDFAALAVTDGARLLPRIGETHIVPFSPAPGYAGCLCASAPAVPRIVELQYTEHSV